MPRCTGRRDCLASYLGRSPHRSDNLLVVGQAIGQFLPLAIGVALSPVAIIVVILMLFSARAKSNGPAFLLGWLIGVGAAAGIALAVSDAASVGSESASTQRRLVGEAGAGRLSRLA